jgi:hypothetical protein
MVTRFLLADGIAELEDFMPVGLPSGSREYRHVYRRMKGAVGHKFMPDLRIELRGRLGTGPRG